MKIYWELVYVYVFLFSAILSLFLSSLSIGLGERLGLIDTPGERKIHLKPKPRSGGIAIFATFILTIVVNLVIWKILRQYTNIFSDDVQKFLPNIPFVLPKVVAILGGAALLFITGIIDDVKPLPPIPKLIIQIAAAYILYISDIKIKLFFDNPLINFIFTAIWVVILTNSFNFLDNMDGLTAGVAIIVSSNLALISYLSGQFFIVIIYMIFIGSMLGFLRYNFYPSKVFMGDSGSLFIGFTLAALTIMVTYYKKGIPTTLPVITPLIILGLPLFDTISVMLIRIRNKKSLMRGDKNHFSHRLVELGMSQKGAVIFIYLVTFIIGLNALYLRRASFVEGLIILIQTILLFVIIFLLEHIPRRERRLGNGKKENEKVDG